MEEIKKINSALLKADFTAIVDGVRTEKRPVIIQRNNKDIAALVPLELLAMNAKKLRGR